jgi:hypothetical protein
MLLHEAIFFFKEIVSSAGQVSPQERAGLRLIAVFRGSPECQVSAAVLSSLIFKEKKC